MSLRAISIFLTFLFVVLAIAPFILYGYMPNDPVEPQKITYGAAGILGLITMIAFAVSMLLLIAAIVAYRKADRLTTAIALPAPLIALIVMILGWLDGM